ncbi:hypothetical protein LK06_029410 [Streptomyces pluripotens]|nr:hypothetical protein LK06_029410 [Streptomyces pluripotens]
MPHGARTIDGDVYVSPRYLGGSTAIGGPGLAPLLDLGWELEHDDLGNAYLNAPDHKVRLGYLPEGEDDGLWRINTYTDPFGPPTWGVCFNNSCPTEFVTAFTTVLAAMSLRQLEVALGAIRRAALTLRHALAVSAHWSGREGRVR